MGMSFGEIVKVAKETSGCTRGGARFREKRQRIGEGPARSKCDAAKNNHT